MSERAHVGWSVAGECILAWVRRPRRPVGLPAGLRPLPGPVAVVCVRYTDSPAGPYLELSLAEPARLGLKPGFCIRTLAVTAAAVVASYRADWGPPPQIAHLRWLADDDERELAWEGREIVIRGRPRRGFFPAPVPLRALQRRADGPVLVPRLLFAANHPAHVDITVPDDDELAWLAGGHKGALMAGMHVVTRPAGSRTAALRSIRAPGWVPEPALLGYAPPGTANPVQWRPARALSSVG